MKLRSQSPHEERFRGKKETDCSESKAPAPSFAVTRVWTKKLVQSDCSRCHLMMGGFWRVSLPAQKTGRKPKFDGDWRVF